MTTDKVRLGHPNVYADLGLPDAKGMAVKAQLAMKISDAITAKKLTQANAAAVTGLTQPKLSSLLRGHFHAISEAKMMDCLVALGHDIEIVVRPAAGRDAGRVQVVSRQRRGSKLASDAPAA